VRGVKRLVNESWSRSEEEALQLEARIQMTILASPNQAEAVRANLEDRDPDFAD
jgi:enoyl-CoA hydratase/carnithine racemase